MYVNGLSHATGLFMWVSASCLIHSGAQCLPALHM